MGWSPPNRLLWVGLSSSSRTVLVGWFESRHQGVRKLSLAPHTLAHSSHMPALNLTCTFAGGYTFPLLTRARPMIFLTSPIDVIFP